jgi:hypothetical protein
MVVVASAFWLAWKFFNIFSLDNCQLISPFFQTLFSNLFVTLNSSINLFIYCAFGKKFRKELKDLLVCKKTVTVEQFEFHSQNNGTSFDATERQSIRRNIALNVGTSFDVSERHSMRRNVAQNIGTSFDVSERHSLRRNVAQNIGTSFDVSAAGAPSKRTIPLTKAKV